MIEQIVNHSRWPYTYHHDFVRQRIGGSRSEIAQKGQENYISFLGWIEQNEPDTVVEALLDEEVQAQVLEWHTVFAETYGTVDQYIESMKDN